MLPKHFTSSPRPTLQSEVLNSWLLSQAGRSSIKRGEDESYKTIVLNDSRRYIQKDHESLQSQGLARFYVFCHLQVGSRGADSTRCVDGT